MVVGSVLAVLFVAYLRRAPRATEAVRPATAVGDATCLTCHSDKASFEETAHRITMRVPTPGSILGSFREGENVLRSSNPNVYFRMLADSKGFYQSRVSTKGSDTVVRTERIAYVAGSGRKGQSFLYWSEDQVFHLPVSYWTSLHRWIGNPGPMLVAPSASFDRAVAPRCFECHATWIDWMPDLAVINRYDPDSTILGITCERCHGAGREHVARQRSVFRALRQPAIVNPARLSRERQMDACAQCHAGLGTPRTPPFTYVAGKSLDDYLVVHQPATAAVVDIHGNQVALLARSPCYRSSQMTCLTCHDVHRKQRDPVELSGRCLQCHQLQRSGLSPEHGPALAGRCVDCHMPLQSSKLVVSDLEGQQKRAQSRTHWIRTYPETARW